MRGTAAYVILAVVLISILLMKEGSSFMTGPCRKKRWSKCHPVAFDIVKRSNSPLPEQVNHVITAVDWKDLVRKRSGMVTRQALLETLKALKADIVAEIQVEKKKK